MKYLSLFIALSIAASSFAQTKSIQLSPPLAYGEPSSVGMSEERLSEIDDMCKNAVEEGIVPGIVALIARDGIIVFHEAYGMANNEENRKLKKDDIFRIASQTKAITATAVMMLWEKGKFALDDPISMYIPEFGKAKILDTFSETDSSFTSRDAKTQITIRHLLTHTSGVGYGFIDNDPRFRKIYQKAGIIDGFTTEPITIEENIKKLAKMPLHHNPGDAFVYSEGLDILGYLIEKVSGLPMDRFYREHIFEPLGMDDTWFYLPESKQARLVTVQTKKNNQWIPYPATPYYDPDYPLKGAKTYFAGGAGLCSTAKDYATFLQMYLNNGELNGVRLLSRTTIQFMMANQMADILIGPAKYYGLAFAVLGQRDEDLGGNGSEGTFEWGGYFNTQYFADPKENIIGILMKQTQESGGDYTGKKFRQMVFPAIDD